MSDDVILNDVMIQDLCIKMVNMSRKGEYEQVYDIDGNGVINLLDILLAIKAWTLLKAWACNYQN